MTYPQPIKNEVLNYLAEGHSIRDAAKTFGISKSAVFVWKKERYGASHVWRGRRAQLFRKQVSARKGERKE